MANTKIPSELIADSSITAAKLADGTITTADIADSNVTTAKIADSNVTTAKIGDAQVTTAKITDANVTTVKIADDAVTTAKMASNSVTSDTIASGITLAGNTTFSGNILKDSGDLTLDVPGAITLDAGTGGTGIVFADDGTSFGSLKGLPAAPTRLIVNSAATAGYLSVAGTEYFAWNTTDIRPAQSNMNLGVDGASWNDLYITGDIKTTSGDLTLDVAGDINLDADGGSVFFKDAGTEFFKVRKVGTTHVQLYSAQNNVDIKFEGVDDGVGFAALTLDMSEAGAATFNSTVTLTNTLSINGSTAQAFLQTSSNVFQIGTSSNDPVDFYANNTRHMSLRSDGEFIVNEQGNAEGDFRVESDTNTHALFVDASENTVGIGTDSPTKLLHVNGQAQFENNIILNENTPALVIPNGDFRLFTGGSETLRVTSGRNLQFIAKTTNFESPGFTYHTNNYLYLRGGTSGLILSDDSGINTIQIIDGSSGYINFETSDGSSKMHLASDGALTLKPNGITTGLRLQGRSSDNNFYIQFKSNDGNTTYSSIGTDSANTALFYQSNTHKFQNSASNITYMTIDSSGNVGIAAIPSGEAAAAHVVRLGDKVCIAEYDDGSNPEQFNLFHNSDSSETYIETGYATNIQQRNGEITFKTAASGSAGAAITFSDKLKILNNGNVGIGTTTAPLGKLSVGAGSINDAGLPIQISTGADGTQAWYAVNRNGAYGALFGYSASSTYKGLVLRNVVSSGTANADGISFMTNNSSMRMHITGDGKVGIGTDDPYSKLQVSGTVSSGTNTKPTHAVYDNSGNMKSFEHVFSATKGTASGALNKTLVDVSGLSNFHQAIFIVEYATRLQAVSDSTTGFVHRVYALNRFNGGNLNVTETTAIAGSSNSLAHALVNVEIVSNTQYRIRVEFSNSITSSSFASGTIRAYGASDYFPTISFAEGMGNT